MVDTHSFEQTGANRFFTCYCQSPSTNSNGKGPLVIKKLKYSPASSVTAILMYFYFQGERHQAGFIFRLFPVTHVPLKTHLTQKGEKQSKPTSPVQVNESLAPCVIMETLSTVLLQLNLFNPHSFGHHLAHFVVYAETV